MVRLQIRHFGFECPMISSSLLHFGQQNFIRSFHRVPPINFLHDLFSPPDRVRDCGDGCGHALPTVILRQLPGCEDRRHDSDYALPALVHSGSLALSPCIRHARAGYAGSGRINGSGMGAGR